MPPDADLTNDGLQKMINYSADMQRRSVSPCFADSLKAWATDCKDAKALTPNSPERQKVEARIVAMRGLFQSHTEKIYAPGGLCQEFRQQAR